MTTSRRQRGTTAAMTTTYSTYISSALLVDDHRRLKSRRPYTNVDRFRLSIWHRLPYMAVYMTINEC